MGDLCQPDEPPPPPADTCPDPTPPVWWRDDPC